MSNAVQRLWQHLRYAARQLLRSPGFALTAVLTLALGIGANTAIFSLLDQALLRSLPVRDPQQLVVLQGTGKFWEGHTSGNGGDASLYFSYPMYQDLQTKSPSFSGILATSTAQVGILHNGVASVEEVELVTGNYFTLLGIRPALGRLLSPDDDTASSTHQAAVLGYEYWRDHLGADTSMVGRTLDINGSPVVIVGIAQPGFRSAVWGQTPALFVPLNAAAALKPSIGKEIHRHTSRWLNLIARLPPGVSSASAEAQLAPLWHALRAEELKALGTRSPSFVDDFLVRSRLHLLPGAQGLSYSRERLQRPLYTVAGMALLVLAIASLNVASLLLVRSSARVSEFGIRRALGAPPRAIVSQLLVEGLLIGLFGAAVGVLLAPLAIRVISSRLTSPGDPQIFSSSIDGRVLAFGFLVTLAVSVLFSLAPALRLLRAGVGAQTGTSTGQRSSRRLLAQRSVVALQIGLSTVLLVGAGLFVKTLNNLRHTAVGFDTSNLLTFAVDPALSGYTPERAVALREQALATLSTTPGVLSAAAADNALLDNDDSGTNVTVEGYVAPPDEDLDIGRINVTPGYFTTLREPLLYGRDFTDSDDETHPLVAIVNQSFARHYFGSAAAAIGKRMARGGGSNVNWMQIIGVAADAKVISLRDDVKMTDFTTMKQAAKVSPADRRSHSFQIFLRTTSAPAAAIGNVEASMRRIAPAVALHNLRTLDEQIEQNLGDDRIIGLLATSFAALATLLAGVGMYGVLAYSTAMRTQEIGIRIALGSPRTHVVGLVVRDVLILTVLGVAAALPCALLLARALRSQLYGVSLADPITFLTIPLLLFAVAAVAAVLPARRAAITDPMQALRSE